MQPYKTESHKVLCSSFVIALAVSGSYVPYDPPKRKPPPRARTPHILALRSTDFPSMPKKHTKNSFVRIIFTSSSIIVCARLLFVVLYREFNRFSVDLHTYQIQCVDPFTQSSLFSKGAGNLLFLPLIISRRLWSVILLLLLFAVAVVGMNIRNLMVFHMMNVVYA